MDDEATSPDVELLFVRKSNCDEKLLFEVDEATPGTERLLRVMVAGCGSGGCGPPSDEEDDVRPTTLFVAFILAAAATIV